MERQDVMYSTLQDEKLVLRKGDNTSFLFMDAMNSDT